MKKKPENKAPLWRQIGDIAGALLQDTHRVISIFLLSVFTAIFASYAAAYPGGPGQFIGEVYATVCLTGGACDIPTLNAGLTMAVILVAGLSLSLLVALSTNDVESLADELLEAIQDLQNQVDELSTRAAFPSELIQSGASPSAVGDIEEIPTCSECGALVEIDTDTGKAVSIDRISVPLGRNVSP